jgi:superfamily I DNA/RNA helicase
MGAVNQPQSFDFQLAPLDDAKRALLSNWTAATLVIGGPGTGKTTLLGQAAVAELAADGPDPVVLVSSRTAASRLRNAITTGLGAGTWSPQVTTVHALARSLWQRFSTRPQVRLLAAPEQEFRVRELLAGAGPSAWPPQLGAAVTTRAFATQVRACLARTRQLGLDPEDLIEMGAAAGREEWSALGSFMAEYLDVLDAEEVLDYAELVHRVRLLLSDLEIGGIVAAEIGAVLIDDYAELDPAQIRMVAALAPTTKVLATADPDSVSAAFRGADPRALRGFEESFASPARAVRFARLEQAYRYGPDLDQVLARVRARLPQLGSAAPVTPQRVNPDGGRPNSQVSVWVCGDEAEQSRAIADRLRQARLDGIDYRQMAVLVRSGRQQLGPIAQGLVSAGIPVELPGDEIPLAQAPSVRPLLLGLATAAAQAISPDQAVRLLTGPLCGLDSVGLRALARQWLGCGHHDASDSVGATQLAAALNDSSWLVETETTEHSAKLAALVALLTQAQEQLADGRGVDEVCWSLWQGTDWPSRLAEQSAGYGATASRADADLDAVCAFFEVAAEAGHRKGVAGVRAFLAELDAQQIPADRQRESRLRRRAVQILTAHRARGQEWDLVVVAGVQEGLWPSGRRLSAVLEAAELTTDGLVGRTSAREELAAERRLFHLACSRARQSLVVTATAGTEGESDSASRFLAELGVSITAPPWRKRAVTLNGLVAGLRRDCVDPARSDSVRAAAAIELAALADVVDDAGRALVPAANPRSWWGVRELSSQPVAGPRQIWLSPSQVNAALTCPRRYFLSRQAQGEAGTTLAATLGSLIHRLVQTAQTEDWGLPELRTELDRVWGRLPFEAAWFSASERVEVEQALARFLNWRAKRVGQAWVEVPFRIELEADGLAVVLAGQIDWLERTEDGLLVADFKTSRRQPSKAEVAGMEQLGIYQLAVSSGAFTNYADTSVIAPSGASAVYLRQASRPEDVPKEFWQPALSQRPHLTTEAAELAYPTWVHHRIAMAAAIVAEGSYPATAGAHCTSCAFATSCPANARGEQLW